MDQSPWETNQFSASQEIPPFYVNQTFITSIHMCLPPAPILSPYHWINPGLRHQFRFHNMILFRERSRSHITQTLSWSTTLCWLSTTAYWIYSRLPSILEAIPPSTTWIRAIEWWQVLTYVGYIPCNEGFIITNNSEYVLSVCITNTIFFFLLDVFYS